MTTDSNDTLFSDRELEQLGAVDPYPNNPVHFNIRQLSYSGRLLKRSCPRKYELTKLSQRPRDDNDENGHLNFGTVVGNGIQEYLITGSIDAAIFKVFCTWNDFLDSDAGAKSAKTFWHAIQAIQKFALVRADQLAQYELAYFNEKPAVELGFRINCGNGFNYRGFIDALLIHKVKREFLVLECKTTGYTKVDAAMYANSDQAIGYGLVIDAVAHQMDIETNSYYVMYPVYMTKQAEWEIFRFLKTNNDRALWLQSLLLEIQHIQQYSEMGYYPTQGESCYNFNRQCQFFGICGMSNEHLIGDLSKIPIMLDPPGKFTLEYSVMDLITAQLVKE